VFRSLFGTRAADLALGGEAHDLELGANWEALVENEPDEGAHFSWAGAVPYSGDGLRSCCVPEVEALDERDHVRGV
jgi:hypothetical protein